MNNIYSLGFLITIFFSVIFLNSCSNQELIRQYIDADHKLLKDSIGAIHYLEFYHQGDSIPNGEVIMYSLEGEIVSKGKYNNGKRNGVFDYYERSTISHQEYFLQDTIILRGYKLKNTINKFPIDTLKILGEYIRKNKFSAAIKVYSEYTYAYEKRGDFLKRKGKTTKARRDYQKCLELESFNTGDLHRKIGETQQLEGKIEAAIASHEEAVQDYTDADKINSAKSHFELGRLYFTEGKYEKSIQEYSKAIQLNPNVSKYYSNRAWTYMSWNKGKYFQEASNDCEKAIQLDGRNANAYGFLAFIEVKKGNYSKALSHAQKGYKYDPSNQFVELIYQSLTVKEKAESIPYIGGRVSNLTNSLNWVSVILTLWEYWDYYSIAKMV